MTLIHEAAEIIQHAKDDYRAGKITAQQFCNITRIPLTDMYLTLYADGETSKILASDIYTPTFIQPITAPHGTVKERG